MAEHRFLGFYSNEQRRRLAADWAANRRLEAENPKCCRQSGQHADASSSKEDLVPEETLDVIRQAANRQWRRLQDSGVETSKLLQLAATILQCNQSGPANQCSQLEPTDADASESFQAKPLSLTEDDSIWLESSLEAFSESRETEIEEDLVSTGGTIRLTDAHGQALIVSKEGFFKLSFDFAEALLDMEDSVRHR